MTLLVELKKELRKTEQARKEFESKVAMLKQKETRIRQMVTEFSDSTARVRHHMTEEHRRKISEALKRRHAADKP